MSAELVIALSDEQLQQLAELLSPMVAEQSRQQRVAGKPYSVREAAMALNLSESTVRSRCHNGDIHCTRQGARILIPTQEINRIQSGN